MMNKKQKILTILGLGLILFLIGTPLIRAVDTPPPAASANTNKTDISGIENLGKPSLSPIKNIYNIYKLNQLSSALSAATSSAARSQTLEQANQTANVMSAQYIVGVFGFWLVKAAALLTNFFLDLNFKILNNPFVTTGWSISRDLANLGFVLFIIIIAIATILRYQEYSAKSTLAKLIAVALLVNFSLLGAGVFIDFSNMLTSFFIGSITNRNSEQLADSISRVFEPGKLLQIQKEQEKGWLDKIKGLFEAVTNPGKSLEALATWVIGLSFVIIFTLLLAFVLFSLAIMFLIRLIALNILLVLVPLACLFWILPITKNLWEKWWNSFIRWILFAPAASFFIFLTITMADKIKALSEGFSGVEGTAGGTGGTTLMNEFASLPNADLPARITTGVMLIGFVLGGLIVANSLSIHGAKTFYGWAQAAGKGARAWTGRKGIQYGTSLLRRKGTEEGAKSIAERTQAWAAARKTGLGRYAAGWVARGTTRLATAGGEDQIKYHEKQVADMSIPDTKAALLTAFGPRKIALIKKIMSAKQLGNVDMTRIATDDTKKLFARFGQVIPFGDTEKAGLMSVEMNEARIKDDREALLRATETLMAKFTKKDVEPAAWKDMFSGKAKFGLDEKSLKKMSQYTARALSTKNPALVANIIPKLDSTSRNNFVEAYTEALKGVSKETSDAFKKTMANYAVGFSPTEAAAETTK